MKTYHCSIIIGFGYNVKLQGSLNIVECIMCFHSVEFMVYYTTLSRVHVMLKITLTTMIQYLDLYSHIITIGILKVLHCQRITLIRGQLQPALSFHLIFFHTVFVEMTYTNIVL